jgi:polar amino acid transport system substrate-binding protein
MTSGPSPTPPMPPQQPAINGRSDITLQGNGPMRNRIPTSIRRLATRATLAAWLCLSATAQGAVVTTGDWPPWMLVSEDNGTSRVTGGLVIDLIRELSQRLDLDVSFRVSPWQRSLADIKTGDVDMMPLVSHTRAREAFMVFSEPVYVDPLMLVASTRRGDPARCDWRGTGKLKGKVVGTVRDYRYGDHWEQFVEREQVRTLPANDDRTNVRKVAGGRLDYTVQYYSHLKTILQEENVKPDRLAVCNDPVESVALHLGISRRSPLAARVQEINRVLREMHRDGTYRRLLGDLYRPAPEASLSHRQ